MTLDESLGSQSLGRALGQSSPGSWCSAKCLKVCKTLCIAHRKLGDQQALDQWSCPPGLLPACEMKELILFLEPLTPFGCVSFPKQMYLYAKGHGSACYTGACPRRKGSSL